jgi:hypothetical protein
MSILIQYIDPNIRCYPLLYCPNMRNPVGKDAEYALKVLAKLSDKKWKNGHGKTTGIRKGSYVNDIKIRIHLKS